MKNKGFTLIEMLIVIAIIGILSSVILVGLGSARAKARDSRRISDIRQIQNGLEIYYSKTQVYVSGDSTALYAPTPDLPALPYDPQGTAVKYLYLGAAQSYQLGACLEQGLPAGITSATCSSLFCTAGTLYCVTAP